MPSLEMRDVSPSGHVLSGAVVEDLPERTTLREILRTRVHGDVAVYNRDPGLVYRGLVQPEDATRYSDGFRMATAEPLDAAHLFTAVEEAVAAGVVAFEVDGETVTDLDHVIEPAATSLILTVMRRPVVARRPPGSRRGPLPR